MAKKSKLTQHQWNEIEERFYKGESASKLGREFNTSESTIRTRYSAKSAKLNTVVNQVIAAETALKELPISARITANLLIEDMRSTMIHLAGAAKFGSITAHRLSMIANEQVDNIDSADLAGTLEHLRSVTMLTAVANESSKIGINLISASKEAVKSMMAQEIDITPLTIGDDPVEASRTYQKMLNGI
jgi:hypothetical protein